jgi:broad-specificity NMP kinase
MKILLFGSIAAGKTEIAKKVFRKYPHFTYIAIDDFRRKFGNGTIETERKAQAKFLKAINKDAYQIIEASGFGILGWQLFEILSKSNEIVLIVIFYIEKSIIYERLKNRIWDIPFPYAQNNLDEIISSINNRVISGEIQNTWFKRQNTHFLQVRNKDANTNAFIIKTITNFINIYGTI